MTRRNPDCPKCGSPCVSAGMTKTIYFWVDQDGGRTTDNQTFDHDGHYLCGSCGHKWTDFDELSKLRRRP